MLKAFETIKENNKEGSIQLTLTDLHPNAKFIERINNLQIQDVAYSTNATDATNIAVTPKGLKTMIACFHHMNPKVAQKILQSAQESREPILIYELAKNSIPTLIWWILLPLSLVVLFAMALIMTLFVRPLSFSQIFFTYVIPIIPLVYAWDGQASLMRTYTFEDLHGLMGNSKDKGYRWVIADAKKANGKNLGYYIMGTPINKNAT